MIREADHPWLSRYALVTAVAGLVLICFGGLVTSHGAGMAVPDWPNTFGYNMFFFPVSRWVGGIFYEHTHRLAASGVGLMTMILAVWLWLKEPRKWLRWLGVIALVTVILQGILGGLRVILFKDELGIFHATLAQLFFSLLCVIALATSRWWRFCESLQKRIIDVRGLRWTVLLAALLILTQLIVGATMRHQHAGLSIPDFPTAYGRWWPQMDPSSVAEYNRNRVEVTPLNPITAFQIGLQMSHRIIALFILVAVVTVGALATRTLGVRHPLTRLATFWIGLILVQVLLGAATIWTGKSADIATTHVAIGALSLMTGVVAAMIAFRVLAPRTVLAASHGEQTPAAVPVMAGLGLASDSRRRI